MKNISNNSSICLLFNNVIWKKIAILFLCGAPFLIWAYAGLWEYLALTNISCALLSIALILTSRQSDSKFYLVVFFVFCLIITALLSGSNIMELWQMIFIFFAATIVFRHQKGIYLSAFMYVLIIVCITNSFIGIVQWFELDYHFAPLVFNSPDAQVVGNIRQRNNLATLLAIGVGITAYLYNKNIQSREKKGGVFAASIVFTCLVALTQSRIGLLGVISIGVLSWFVLKNKAIALVAIIGTGVFNVIFSIMGWGSSAARLAAGDSACASRLTIWQDGLEMIKAQPLAGWGWGNLRYAQALLIGEGISFQSCLRLGNLHNMPLQIAATFGIPIFIVCTLFFCWLIYKSTRTYTSEKSVFYIVLVPLFLHSMVEYPLHKAPFLIILGWAFSGIIKGCTFDFFQNKKLAVPLNFLFTIFLCFFMVLEYSNKSLAKKIHSGNVQGITAIEQFFYPAPAFSAALYFAPLTPDSAKLKLMYTDTILKTSVSRQLLSELKRSADLVGDKEKSIAFERMIKSEEQMKLSR